MAITLSQVAMYLTSVSVIGGIVTLVNEFSFSLSLLFLFILIDFITGVWAHFINNEFSWDKLYKGLIKKSIYPIIVFFGFVLAMLAVSELSVYLGEDILGILVYIVPTLIILLCAIEITSTINNLRYGEFPIPQFLLNVFKYFDEKKK